MGWFDGWFGSNRNDPLQNLDPKLQEFLAKESPVKYQTSAQNAQQTKPQPTESPSNAFQDAQTSEPAAPRPSLFPDGRYQHLWKTYRPLADIEAETKNHSEKLMDVLEGYKERKSAIGRAALENCAIEQEEWMNCMKSGSWEDRLQMCRHQVRRFERCYTMQSRFLRVLGYQTEYDRRPEVDEDIQMHADGLFRRMLDHEAAVQVAKKEGRPIPVFEHVLPQVTPGQGREPDEETRRKWKEKLEHLPEDERATEEAALHADLRAKEGTATKVEEMWKQQDRERRARLAAGKATFGDHIWSFIRKPPSDSS